MQNAKIVVDLGFGDSGKGVTVDSLCIGSTNPIVIRFSGGQQCGHSVWIDEKTQHTHSSFGSGTLRGIPSYFSEHCTMYLTSIFKEYEELLEKGVSPQLYLHPLTKVTTPYDIAFNRLNHLKSAHGTVGLGIGATMDRHLNTGYKLHVIDFTNKTIFYNKLEQIKQYYLHKINTLPQTYQKYFNEEYPKILDVFNDLFDSWHELFKIKDYTFLDNYQNLIFEGSQGIMLDMDHGTFPNVTYASTTSKNAIEICNLLKIDSNSVEIFYVTRCYLTRHGNGWLPDTESPKLINNEHEINITNQWQGNFKTRELDYDLLNYALKIDNIYSGRIFKNLVITCTDQLPNFDIDFKKLNKEYLYDCFQRNSHISSEIKAK